MNSAKIEKFCCHNSIRNSQVAIASDLQLSGEKHNHVTHAASQRGILEAATPLPYANNELQKAIDSRTQASQIAAVCSSKPDLDVETEKRRF